MMSIKSVFILTIISLLIIKDNKAQQIEINSPDKKIMARVLIGNDGKAIYTISYLKELVLQNSKLGIVREDADFSAGLQFVSTSKQVKIKDDYTILNAKKSHITYSANKRMISLKNRAGQKMNIIFQVSNDGVAFKYEFPEQSIDVKKIKEETTSFHFIENTLAWLQPKTEAQSGWEHTNPSYEAHYKMGIPTGTPSPGKNGWVYPAMFNYKNTWLIITEAGLGRTYCGTALQQQSRDNEYSINFPEEPERVTNGVLFPESTLPWQTPWRIIALGSLKTITESTLGTDLAFPAKQMDASFIKQGQSSWSWILSKDNYIVYDEQKKYIDHASGMQWEYCLIDVNWDTKIGYDRIKELADYAGSKNVGLILWYNSAGNWNTVKYAPKDKLLTHEGRIKEFSRIHQMGIKGIKVDFFPGDGQSVINYYHDILEDAAVHKLLVNFHGATLPRGLQRTYPNFMTAEAVYGYEMITFRQQDADSAAAHMVMCAFARNAFDPMDFTPVSLYKIPKIDRRTSVSFELATAVIFLSGIQHYVEGPEGMSKMSTEIKNYMQTVPAFWDDVKFIDGYPGKYYVVARRSGKKWYVAGINADSTQREITMDLSFIAKQKTGTVFYSYKEDVSASTKQVTINQKKKNTITMQANDGFVMVFE